jgi:hypothetical protein
MTQDDQRLIDFLLSAGPQELRDWYNQASDEDLIYASYLMDVYGHELEDQLRADCIDREIAQMKTLTLAQAVIAAVR